MSKTFIEISNEQIIVNKDQYKTNYKDNDLSGLKTVLKKNNICDVLLDVNILEKEIKLPKLNKTEIRKSIDFEIEKMFPSIADNFVYNYKIIGTDNENCIIKIYLTKKEDILNKINPVKDYITIRKLFIKNTDKSFDFNFGETKSGYNILYRKNIIKRIMIACSLALIYISVINIFDLFKLSDEAEKTNANIKIINLEYMNAEGYYKKYSDILETYNIKKELLNDNIDLCKYLFIITGKIDKKIYLTRVEKLDKLIECEGRAGSEEGIISYIDKLKKAGLFKSATLKYTEKAEDYETIIFKIELSV